jgi:hypothetical protein
MWSANNGDGVTIKLMPLFNMLVATYGHQPAVLMIHDASEYLVLRRKKDMSKILNIFRQHMEELDSMKDKC